MREFKNALIGCTCVVLLSIAGIAIWTVRAYLPIVGIVLLVALGAGVLLALVYAIAHVHHKITAYAHIPIAQYGSVLHRRNQIVQIAPYHPVPSIAARRAGPQVEDYVEGEIEEANDMPALPPRIPTFAEMLKSGMIQTAISRGQMIIGFYAESHQPRYGSWIDLYSAGNGGVSGSGKSTTTRFLLFQAVLAGAKLIMIDPHIGDPDESLSHQFSLLPASIHQIRPCDGRDNNVAKRVDWLTKELDRRKRPGAKSGIFLVLIIDEFNSVMRHASKEVREHLTKLLLDIEQEGRKFGIFALLIGQRWSAQDLGGADIRTSLASKIAHRFSDEDQAKRFMGSKHGKKLLEMETGHWLFYDTKGKTSEMITPETVARDGAMIAQIITGAMSEPDFIAPEIALKPRENTLQLPERTTGALARQDTGFCGETTGETTEEISPESPELINLARRIMALQAEGVQKAEIMRQIWGVNPGGSQDYKNAQARYQEVMQFVSGQIGVRT